MLYILAVLTVFAISILLVCALFRRELQACFERDPAARNSLEVILTCSGLHAIAIYRIAHTLWLCNIPVFPRLISQLGRFFTGVEIHPAAKIGKGLFIDHGMGVVIGETAVIEDNVTIFQGVTLGGTGKQKGKRHPSVGKNVVIGAGAKILGNIVIGENSAIGANAVVIRDIPPNSTVVGVPGRVAKKDERKYPGIFLDHSSLPDPLAERIENLQHEIDLIEQHMKEIKGKNKDKM